ncbi:hypothetical protein CBS101457_005411 [Exobasidium rhododendri]|nr:hypothetical protein CBS101457_005411 [Exobasidium rhododendri]
MPLSIAQRRFLKKQVRPQAHSQSPQRKRPEITIPSPIITVCHSSLKPARSTPYLLGGNMDMHNDSRWSPDNSIDVLPPESHDSSVSSTSMYSHGPDTRSASGEDYSSESSTDIVRAHRETVKRAQPHMVRWQSPSGQDLWPEMENAEWDYDDVLRSYEDEKDDPSDDQSWQQDTSNDVVVKKRFGMLPGALLFKGQDSDLLQKLQRASQETTVESFQCLKTEDDDCHSNKKQSQTELPVESTWKGYDCRKEDTRSAHRRAASKVETTHYMPNSSSQKTSFFHHSTLRRHNSTDNFARAQLGKRLLESGASITVFTKGSPMRLPKRKANSPPHTATRCSLNPQEKAAIRTASSRPKENHRNSFGPLMKGLDMLRVNEKLMYTRSKYRQDDQRGSRDTSVERNPTTTQRSKTEASTSQPASPTFPFLLRKVRSMQHVSVPLSPSMHPSPLKASHLNETTSTLVNSLGRTHQRHSSEAKTKATVQ